MLFNIVPLHQFLSNYKGFIAQVKKNRNPVIIANHNEAQVALISLQDLKELQDRQHPNATKSLLKLTGLIPKGSGLSRDLSKMHSKYAWD